MSMFLHTVVGSVILQILWWVWIRHYFYTPQNLEDINDEVHEWLKKL